MDLKINTAEDEEEKEEEENVGPHGQAVYDMLLHVLRDANVSTQSREE